MNANANNTNLNNEEFETNIHGLEKPIDDEESVADHRPKDIAQINSCCCDIQQALANHTEQPRISIYDTLIMQDSSKSYTAYCIRTAIYPQLNMECRARLRYI